PALLPRALHDALPIYDQLAAGVDRGLAAGHEHVLRLGAGRETHPLHLQARTAVGPGCGGHVARAEARVDAAALARQGVEQPGVRSEEHTSELQSHLNL